ncbi:MAG: choice-of-anchor D domain-containing protein, partial [Candidatus Kapabacteria bacterium]|nr:choice-of-anchor D domain-containing protein [Candidatus Kapabacteria bacterium]
IVVKQLRTLPITLYGASAPQNSVSTNITYHTVIVCSQLLKDLAVQNPGSAALNLTDISLSGADAADFSITNKPTTIAASGSDKISIQFKPNTEGTKQATLTIKHNAGNDAVVQITGIGKKVNNTSVLDDAVTKFTQVFPNPANDNVTFAFTLAEQSNVNLVISDLLGNDVVMVHNGVVDAGYASLQASTTALSAGVYVYRLRVGSNTYSQRFVVAH